MNVRIAPTHNVKQKRTRTKFTKKHQRVDKEKWDKEWKRACENERRKDL